MERLVLGGRGHVPLGGQMRQELVELGAAHFLGMPLPVMENKPSDPPHVRLFRPIGKVMEAEDLPALVEETGFGVGSEALALASARR